MSKERALTDRQQAVLARIDDVLAAVEREGVATFGVDLTRHLTSELLRMREARDLGVFSPSSGRPLVDCHEGPPADRLLRVGHEYRWTGKNGRMRQGVPGVA